MAASNARGARLKEGRTALNKSPEEVAEEVGTSKSAYLKWEYGQTEPKTLDQVEKACQAVGISIDYFIMGKECVPALPPTKQELIDHYCGLAPELQTSVLNVVRAMKT